MLGRLLLSVALTVWGGTALAEVRIKDIVTFEGVRANQLVGYGLVVGLDGTGDTMRNSPFTRSSIEGMLGRLGVGNLSDQEFRTANTAAVMVTAEFPPFGRRGTTIDVVVSSLGDAKSLHGGTLLVTPLVGADNEIYAVAQGPLAVGGFSAQGAAASIKQGVPTVARIENGALIEREVEFSLGMLDSVRLALRNPDFTTASRIAEVVNKAPIGAKAKMLDPGTVEVAFKDGAEMAETIAKLEKLTVEPDTPARVVVDSKSGTIVIGSDVRIDQVAISQGGLTVSVRESAQVSQPEPFSVGQTVVVPQTTIDLQRRESGFAVMGGQVSLQELVDGLNAIGVGAREIISILQAIKAAGALHADLEVI
jgi:flagellar P-ring protein precursor FlgI